MIEVRNITKKYGNFTAVDNINFKIKEGEIVGLLGGNGAGKSTTMNMITNFIEPTEGKIFINGMDISKNPRKTKSLIGYMPETTPLYYELTVREFVTYMAQLREVKKKEIKDEVDKVLKNTFIEDVQNKLIRNLSRGYKQRVSLAGALVGNPPIIILDEPTVGLDPKQIIEIRELIKSLKDEHTVILSSHILHEVSQICDKVIIINKGKIVAIDTPENLEEEAKQENSMRVVVEDSENKMEAVKDLIEGIKKIELEVENDDMSKTYIITADQNVDLRRVLVKELSKQDIIVLESKKIETTLEEAFVTLIEQNMAESAEPETIETENNKQEGGNE